MKVTVVSQGCYSDESIKGVFSSNEKARAYVSIYEARPDGGDFNFYDFELDELKDEHPGLHPFSVRINSKGATATRLDRDPMYESVTPYSWDSPLDVQVTDCWARDEAHAIKIASDRYSAFKAIVQLDLEGCTAKCFVCGASCGPEVGRPADLKVARLGEALRYFVLHHSTQCARLGGKITP